jgi:hypothetical protein
LAYALTEVSSMKIILSFAFLLFTVHPIHVSVTEIAFDAKEKELEIISRIFLDDLELAIRESKKQPELNLLKPVAPITTDQLISEYLQSRFKVTLNNKPQKWKYIGHEVESDAILCYIQVSGVKKLETIEIFNSVLTEIHADQSNLVHVTLGETVKSLRLMQDNPSGKLTFEIK